MGVVTVAIVGSGPAGLYLADELTGQEGRQVQVDLYDRLPTPFGLLRYGVAPDHLKMKALATPLQRTLDDDRVRFIGNVEVGRDITVEELRAHYSAVVYTYGASLDRGLGVPGEQLVGSTSAAEFVRWYSGHPDTALTGSVLSARTGIVVGAGNVAIDVTRMLVKSADELAGTDVPDVVLAALRGSSIDDVHVLIRRGPAHVRFTSKELRELGELEDVDVVVDPAALELTQEEQQIVDADRATARNLVILREWAARQSTGAKRRIHFHFWTAPTALAGDGTVARVSLSSTRATGIVSEIDAELVVRCVGYRGATLPGAPFDDDLGTIPTSDGRVLRDGVVSPGEYAAGWISRGPVGVLGTNRADATAVVAEMMVDELREVEPWNAADELTRRGIDVVACEGWAAIDRSECDLGQARGAQRAKIASWDELMTAARS